jgi:ribose transport system permease protein
MSVSRRATLSHVRAWRRALDPLALPAMLFVLALVLVGASQSGAFLSTFNISNVLVQVTPLLLVAVGQTFAVTSGGLDLSVGSIISLVAVVAAVLFQPIGAPLAILIALAVGLAVGYLNGVAVAWGLEAFLVTLATLSIAQGVAFLILPTPGGAVPGWYAAFASYWGPMPIALPFALGVAALATAVLRRHRVGAHILAVGGDQETARVNGVRVSRTLVHAYLLSALCASLAALFLLARIRTGDPTIGTAFTLQSLAAVVLGGTVLGGGRASMLGTVFGALALGLLTNVLNFLGVSAFYQTLVTGTLVIIAVLVPNLTSRALSARRRKAAAPRDRLTRAT